MTQKISFSFVLFFLFLPAQAGIFSFIADTFSDESEQQRFHRMLYFKLPLKSIEYHWEFLDRKQFLDGELEITFSSEGRIIKETIFSHGKLSDNWEVISDTDAEDKEENKIYFGFQSRSRYWFDREDIARIKLINSKPLKGYGYDFTAELEAGEHESTAKEIEQYEDDLDETRAEQANAKAFISVDNWKTKWALSKQTAQGTGWGASQ